LLEIDILCKFLASTFDRALLWMVGADSSNP